MHPGQRDLRLLTSFHVEKIDVRPQAPGDIASVWRDIHKGRLGSILLHRFKRRNDFALIRCGAHAGIREDNAGRGWRVRGNRHIRIRGDLSWRRRRWHGCRLVPRRLVPRRRGRQHRRRLDLLRRRFRGGERLRLAGRNQGRLAQERRLLAAKRSQPQKPRAVGAGNAAQEQLFALGRRQVAGTSEAIDPVGPSELTFSIDKQRHSLLTHDDRDIVLRLAFKQCAEMGRILGVALLAMELMHRGAAAAPSVDQEREIRGARRQPQVDLRGRVLFLRLESKDILLRRNDREHRAGPGPRRITVQH